MPGPSLETRHLLLLATLDEAGSLKAAARKLHLTPSALSQQLRELEERLGGALFERGWRRLAPTNAGARLTAAANKLLPELALAESDTRALIEGAARTVRLATVCHQSYRWLPALLDELERASPRVEVTVVAEAATSPYEGLIERKLDAALVVSEMKSVAGVRKTPLFRNELVVLVGRAHPWFGRKYIEPRALAEQHLFVDQGALKRDAALGKVLLRAGVAPRRVTTVPMTGTVPIDMARGNLGVTVMPRWSIEPLLGDDLSAVSVGQRGLWFDWFVATRDEEPSTALAALLHALSRHQPHPGNPAPASSARGRATPARAAV